VFIVERNAKLEVEINRIKAQETETRQEKEMLLQSKFSMEKVIETLIRCCIY